MITVGGNEQSRHHAEMYVKAFISQILNSCHRVSCKIHSILNNIKYNVECWDYLALLAKKHAHKSLFPIKLGLSLGK